MKLKNILTTSSTKTIKGESKGYLTGILYLSPADLVRGLNLCPFASNGCKSACLYTAGRGQFTSVQKARRAKTELYRDNRNHFMNCLVHSIKIVIRKAQRESMVPVIRLNGTSDIRWENILIDGKNIFEIFPEIQFYDYTKDFLRKDAFTNKWSNYHLTFSRSESNDKMALRMLNLGVNVAMVFKSEIPEQYNGYKVYSGDNDDLRFLDSKGGFIIGLIAKGKAKKDDSGFTIDYTNTIKMAA